MAATLTPKISLILSALFQNTIGASTGKLQTDKSPAYAWTSGVLINQADLIYTNTITLAASATTSLDLAGSLTDGFGTVITFARIKALIVLPLAANTNNVLVGGAAANAFVNWVSDATDVVAVRPGGMLALVAPDAVAYAVTGATGDLLKLTNSAGTTGVTFDIVLIGASA